MHGSAPPPLRVYNAQGKTVADLLGAFGGVVNPLILATTPSDDRCTPSGYGRKPSENIE